MAKNLISLAAMLLVLLIAGYMDEFLAAYIFFGIFAVNGYFSGRFRNQGRPELEPIRNIVALVGGFLVGLYFLMLSGLFWWNLGVLMVFGLVFFGAKPQFIWRIGSWVICSIAASFMYELWGPLEMGSEVYLILFPPCVASMIDFVVDVCFRRNQSS